ncbi:MAG TPA: MgtC/SapB family protein [Parvularculaceae bacterium]|nr:MgtC/SapB family protein [Parvularculaceae bacterium]
MADLNGDSLNALTALATAGAAGFLIGFEREWTHRIEGRSESFAGARTFTLVAFTGALAGLLDGAVLAIAAFLLVGALTIVAYRIAAKEPHGGRGGTTEIALMATYLLGLAAAEDLAIVTVLGAVGVTVLLSLKAEITAIASAMDEREIHATLRFLVISVMILPLLPDQGYGPYEALNPRDIWKMVVFISGLSFIGYWLTKWLGAEKGAVLTGLVGGMASSTATTLSLARRAEETHGGLNACAAGIVAANVVMLIRIGILFAVIAPGILGAVLPALGAGAAVGAVAVLIFWRGEKHEGAAGELKLGNPFEMKPALMFGAVLAVISLAAAFGVDRFGEAGLYVVALISGLADVDAITLAAAGDARAGAISAGLAASAAVIAASSNIVVKGVMSHTIGGAALGARVAAAFAAIMAAILAANFLF